MASVEGATFTNHVYFTCDQRLHVWRERPGVRLPQTVFSAYMYALYMCTWGRLHTAVFCLSRNKVLKMEKYFLFYFVISSVFRVAITTQNKRIFHSCCHSGTCPMLKLYSYAKLKWELYDNGDSHVASNCDVRTCSNVTPFALFWLSLSN